MGVCSSVEFSNPGGGACRAVLLRFSGKDNVASVDVLELKWAKKYDRGTAAYASDDRGVGSTRNNNANVGYLAKRTCVRGTRVEGMPANQSSQLNLHIPGAQSTSTLWNHKR